MPLTPSTKVRALALYLPQFHPVPENDRWWGAGFTEWTNAARARPLYRGHRQPNLPGELGFYDLRLHDSREAQADLAQAHGIEGFVYWHYWFAGRRILERPFAEVLASGRPDFPFCLGWANQTWSGVWYGESDRVLIEQTYPGVDDYREHFDALLPALRDRRYVTVNDCPVLIVHRPSELPSPHELAGVWREEAARVGLPGLHLVGVDHHDGWDPRSDGFDASILSRMGEMFKVRPRNPLRLVWRRLHRSRRVGPAIDRAMARPLHVYPYAAVAAVQVPAQMPSWNAYPCIVPNWDNTPRSGVRGTVLHGPTKEAWAAQVRQAVVALTPRDREQRLLIVKSWNEWAEGNYLEPDLRHGRDFLEAFRDEVVGDG